MWQRAAKGSVGAMALAGALALMALPSSPAAAASPPSSPAASLDHAASALTDVGAAKRKKRRTVHRNSGSAAGMAFMGMAMGMMGAAIAESQRRDYYDSYYGGGYAPRYYHQPGYGYYGGRYHHRPYYHRH